MSEQHTITIKELWKKMGPRWRWASKPYEGAEIIVVKRVNGEAKYFKVGLMAPPDATLHELYLHESTIVRLDYISVEEDPFIGL